MSKKFITPAFEKYFERPGVIANPSDGQKDDENHLVLTQESFLALLSRRERFFDEVPLFQPLRRSTLKTLQQLADRGMIGLDGSRPKASGCGACIRKTLATVFLQMLKHIQTLILLLEKNGKLPDLGEELRTYLNTDRKLVVYIRGKGGAVTRMDF